MAQIPLLGPTKAKILNHLLSNRRTAKELAEVLDIQVSAARKHLQALQELNVVEEQFIQEGMGRPKKYYFLTDSGRELFPRRYETILSAVLERLMQYKDKGHAESIVRQVAYDIARQMGIGGEG